jgi:hypothetical protein
VEGKIMGQSAFEKMVKKTFSLVGLNVAKFHGEYPEIWSNIADFQFLFKDVENHTVVSQDRCFMLYQAAKYAGNKEGDIAEVGVYKGGTGKLLAKVCPNKIIHLFDTFTGMPEVGTYAEYHKEGDFSDTSLQSVKQFLRDCGNMVFHPGFFPETAVDIKEKRFCLIHVDVDIYQSVKDCLGFFYDRMVPGGIMIFDDYEWKSCPGVKQAINEFLAGKKETVFITTRYQCMFLKL